MARAATFRGHAWGKIKYIFVICCSREVKYKIGLMILYGKKLIIWNLEELRARMLTLCNCFMACDKMLKLRKELTTGVFLINGLFTRVFTGKFKRNVFIHLTIFEFEYSLNLSVNDLSVNWFILLFVYCSFFSLTSG